MSVFLGGTVWMALMGKLFYLFICMYFVILNGYVFIYDINSACKVNSLPTPHPQV